MGKDFGRWAPLTGVVFAVLLLVGFLASPSTPDSDASAQQAVSSFMTHRTHDRVSVFLLAYASVFAMFFAAALRSYLKARTEGDGLITLGFSGMVIFVVGALTLIGLEFAATDVPAKISPAAEQALNVLQDNVFFALLVGTGIFLIGNGLAIVASAALPKWLGWIAVPLAVIAVTPLGWFVALFALPIWALIVSVLMFMRREAPAAAPAVATG
ncbi:MAG TPA: hypothetical protein VHZ77_01865 [Gaiellaceae bacterium]|nr:hypothetical protein [Gaiellaceae bacterium]